MAVLLPQPVQPPLLLQKPVQLVRIPVPLEEKHVE